VFTHKMNKSQKLLIETGQTRWSGSVGFGDRQGHRRLRRGHPSPSHVASDQGEEHEPRKLWRLWWWIVDLIDKKEKGT
jgi:hypothetical protein